jgi:hypothetical protein
MRADEFIQKDRKLDEILPLVVGAARGIAAGAKLGAKAIGAASKIGGQVSKAIGKTAATTTSKVGQALGSTGTTTVANPPQQPNQKQNRDIERAKSELIQPGKQIPLPNTAKGGVQNYKVTKVQGDDVEIENPDALKDPTAPKKVVYKKQDLMKSISI